MKCPPGTIMLDIVSTKLNQKERQRLMHPLTGGLIFFTRNFDTPEQLRNLITEIRSLRPELLIAVDHEGGRVQRFRQGFTLIPSMGQIGEQPLPYAKKLAFSAGYVLSYELSQYDIDFSFTPVLDIDFGRSKVIGNRAFSSAPETVGELAGYLIDGMHANGMKCCAKHFPGHGYAKADSHLTLPVDQRSWPEIENQDLLPYKMLAHSHLDSIMPAHVLYPSVDKIMPAGFSNIWLKRILRGEMGFEGVIFSDDLGMAGAAIAGNIVERAKTAVQAGCDMILICNQPDLAEQVLASFTVDGDSHTASAKRLAGMRRARLEGIKTKNIASQYAEAKLELSRLNQCADKPSYNDIVGNL
ncbi:MAG: beta-N-acetylhexosaminidase [Pseudomonadota bacterium]|nr:beta-N-acetylhexosaminidase [Pseudomonadota bacterium]